MARTDSFSCSVSAMRPRSWGPGEMLGAGGGPCPDAWCHGSCRAFARSATAAPDLAGAPVEADDPAGLDVAVARCHEPEVCLPLTRESLAALRYPTVPHRSRSRPSHPLKGGVLQRPRELKRRGRGHVPVWDGQCPARPGGAAATVPPLTAGIGPSPTATAGPSARAVSVLLGSAVRGARPCLRVASRHTRAPRRPTRPARAPPRPGATSGAGPGRSRPHARPRAGTSGRGRNPRGIRPTG